MLEKCARGVFVGVPEELEKCPRSGLAVCQKCSKSALEVVLESVLKVLDKCPRSCFSSVPEVPEKCPRSVLLCHTSARKVRWKRFESVQEVFEKVS